MESNLRPASTIADAQSGLSWAAIAAGAVAAAALTLLLVSFGAGLGFGHIAMERFRRVGVDIQSRYRNLSHYHRRDVISRRWLSRWPVANEIGQRYTDEVFFRDTAHGFLAWAFATLIGATALGPTTAYLANGVTTGVVAQATQASNPSEIYVDKLFRTASTPASATGTQTSGDASAPTGAPSGMPNSSDPDRPQTLRLWTAGFHNNGDLSSSDRAYLAQLVAAHTGISWADAEKRVNSVVIDAKTAADNARRNAAQLSFWLTAALLFGALSASLAAAEGGTLRDGTWTDRVLTPRTI